MGYSMDEFFKNASGKIANYTLEEIEAAKKRQKKNGGSFMDNLEQVAPGKRPAAATMDFDSLSKPSTPSMSTTDVNASIKELNENIAKDFGTVKESPVDNATALSKFAGVNDVLKEQVYGQDEFIKRLVIAFKRPFVTERDDNDALNSIYITGPSCTGKHFALTELVKELHNRGVLKSAEIHTMDLSLYPTSGEEKLFLQDLYSALQSKATVIAFENYENCHISMLTRLSDLVATGQCQLSDRYVMQNGQLINVSNAFAGNTVGSFEAKGKYLVFISTRPVDKLANVMGAPFINALGDICTASELEEEALRSICAVHEANLIEKCKKQLAFNLTLDPSFQGFILSHSSRKRGLKGILDAYSNTQKALAELRLEQDDLPTNDLCLKAEEDGAVIIAGDQTIPMDQYLSGGYNGELEAVKEELEGIVGLKEVKEYIYSLEEYFGVQKRRREAGLKAGEVNKHMIFTGNPGTGKTTIARIVSKYLKAIGVLSGGQLVEVSRADLVGRYVGHTAPLVNQVIKSAIGGVLFIDEAYSLHRGNDDNFGLEAIDTLVKGIEDNRDDLVVILAGYSIEMEEFLESNSGLKSRFPNIIDFPDYTGEELLAIAKITAKSKGYTIDESCEAPLLEYFNMVQATRAMDAGNGRLVRNKLEEAILNQSKRLVATPDADMSLLIEMDFELTE